VTYEDGLQFMLDNKLDYFTETSAKNNVNTQEIFIKSTMLLYKEYLKYKNLYNSSNNMFSSIDTKNSSNSFKLNRNKNRLTENKESEIIISSDDNRSGCIC
jgi:hypothetical protein